jgi:type II secretory pathway pseudopilin PulG
MHRSRLQSSLRAFTLTEVVIAIALVLLLLLGVSRVFSLTAQTIGAGNSLGQQLRNHRAIQQNLARDFLGSGTASTTQDPNDGIDPGNIDPNTGIFPIGAPDSSGPRLPSLVISNFRVAAFANEADRRSSQAWQGLSNAQIDSNDIARSNAIRDVDLLDPSNAPPTPGTPDVPIYQYGQRNFRVDTISFWSRGKFQRQTGNLPIGASSSERAFVSNSSGTEAWTFYGILSIHNGDQSQNDRVMPAVSAYGAPGLAQTQGHPSFPAQPNNSNQFASDFKLGRVAMIFKQPTLFNSRAALLDDDGYLEPFLSPEGEPFANSGAISNPTWPFGQGTGVVQQPGEWAKRRVFSGPSTTEDRELERSFFATDTRRYQFIGRFDLVARTVANFRASLAALPGNSTAHTLPLMLQGLAPDVAANNTQANTLLEMNGSYFDRFWTRPSTGASSGAAEGGTDGNVGLNEFTVSQRASLLSDGVSQFIVEFAGDFVTQDPSSAQVTSGSPDGIVDFALVPDPENSASSRLRRVTKWYGMPRKVDAINLEDPDPVTRLVTINAVSPWTTNDVSPVKEMRPSATFPFERNLDVRNVPGYPNGTAESSSIPNTIPFGLSVPDYSAYVCAWGPAEFDAPLQTTGPNAGQRSVGVPSMIRFIVETRDSRGRNQQPVTQEHVFRVKP